MQGFVLLIMLVYLQLFSLVAIQGMSALLLQQKTLRLRLAQLEQQQAVLAVLDKVDHYARPSCTVPVQPYRMMQRPEHWWKLRGCHLNSAGIDYYFVREDLGTAPCSLIKYQRVTAHYYRNTLYQHQGLLVQDTIARSDKLPPACGSPREVHPSRQMLRWLDKF